MNFEKGKNYLIHHMQLVYKGSPAEIRGIGRIHRFQAFPDQNPGLKLAEPAVVYFRQRKNSPELIECSDREHEKIIRLLKTRESFLRKDDGSGKRAALKCLAAAVPLVLLVSVWLLLTQAPFSFGGGIYNDIRSELLLTRPQVYAAWMSGGRYVEKEYREPLEAALETASAYFPPARIEEAREYSVIFSRSRRLRDGGVYGRHSAQDRLLLLVPEKEVRQWISEQGFEKGSVEYQIEELNYRQSAFLHELMHALLPMENSLVYEGRSYDMTGFSEALVQAFVQDIHHTEVLSNYTYRGGVAAVRVLDLLLGEGWFSACATGDADAGTLVEALLSCTDPQTVSDLLDWLTLDAAGYDPKVEEQLSLTLRQLYLDALIRRIQHAPEPASPQDRDDAIRLLFGELDYFYTLTSDYFGDRFENEEYDQDVTSLCRILAERYGFHEAYAQMLQSEHWKICRNVVDPSRSLILDQDFCVVRGAPSPPGTRFRLIRWRGYDLLYLDHESWTFPLEGKTAESEIFGPGFSRAPDAD